MCANQPAWPCHLSVLYRNCVFDFKVHPLPPHCICIHALKSVISRCLRSAQFSVISPSMKLWKSPWLHNTWKLPEAGSCGQLFVFVPLF